MKKEQQLDLYHQMVLIRRVEERGAELYQAGKIGGFMHLYIREEAVSKRFIAAPEPRDRGVTAHCHPGVALNFGPSSKLGIAGILRPKTANLPRRSRSMHIVANS